MTELDHINESLEEMSDVMDLIISNLQDIRDTVDNRERDELLMETLRLLEQIK